MTRLIGRKTGMALALAAGMGAMPALAECPDDEAMQALAGSVLAATPAPPPPVASAEDALCAQGKLVEILAKEWGAPAGYKAGLTSEPAQKAFGASAPVRGVLYADMMLEDGATVPADWGALPRFEADMVVVVADAAINEATSPQEVLAHLSAVHPFIELPDLVVDNPKALNADIITAINVGARKGVLGAAVPVEQSEAFLASLGEMQVVVTDNDGQELARAPGAAVLGHPLNAVLWLRDSGVTFREGDMVSVGSFGPLLAPRPGLTATVSYEGLAGGQKVSVTFE